MSSPADSDARPPIAPGSLPLLGHALPLLRDPLEFLRAQNQIAPVVRILLGRTPVYILADPTGARQVLFGPSHTFDKGGPALDAARPVFGNGLSVCTAKQHRRLRSLVQPAFQRSRINDIYAPVMQAQATALADSWKAGQVVEITKEMHRLSASIAVRTLFSADLVADAVGLADFLPVLMSGIFRRMLVPVPAIHALPSPANRRYTHTLEVMDATLAAAVSRYRQAGSDHGDIFSQLIAGHAETGEEPLSDTELRDQVVALFIGAVETVGTLLAFTLHRLATDPATEARVRSEVDAVVLADPSALFTPDQLPYTTQVLTEVLRLYPPAWLLFRTTSHDTNLADYNLPAGAHLLASVHALHRDPHAYPDPDCFDPTRWQGVPLACTGHGEYLSFGAGTRRCIGDVFGMTEAVIAIATIVRRWRLRPLHGNTLKLHPRMSIAMAETPMRISAQ